MKFPGSFACCKKKDRRSRAWKLIIFWKLSQVSFAYLLETLLLVDCKSTANIYSSRMKIPVTILKTKNSYFWWSTIYFINLKSPSVFESMLSSLTISSYMCMFLPCSLVRDLSRRKKAIPTFCVFTVNIWRHSEVKNFVILYTDFYQKQAIKYLFPDSVQKASKFKIFDFWIVGKGGKKGIKIRFFAFLPFLQISTVYFENRSLQHSI